jgi:GNAT superfamily N-acetyltransferase
VGDGEVRVRLAGTADAPCLSALATQVFLETYATSGIRLALAREAEAQFSRSAFIERLSEPRTRIALGERSGHLIAFAEVVLGARHARLPPGPASELARLYVQSPFLRQGVGRELLARAEALASAEGASTLWLTAWVGNRPALAFYASQGYDELGSTEYAFEGEVFENRLFAKVLRGET